MEDKENKDAENAANKRSEFCKNKKYYKEKIKYYESLNLVPTDIKNASEFNKWGDAIFSLAEIEQDETLFENGFEKYEIVTKLKQSDTDIATVFYNWGNRLSSLAEIKQGESIFKRAFEKYNQAIQLDTKNDLAYCNWGIALYRLVKINKDEKLLEDAFDKYKKAIEINPGNAKVFYNWGITLYRLARMKQKEASCKGDDLIFLLDSALEKCKKAVNSKPEEALVSSLKNASEKYKKDIQSKPDEALASLFKEAFEKYDKAVLHSNSDKPLASLAYCNWGIALYRLAEEKKDVSLFESAFKKYKEAIKLDPQNTSVLFYWGITLYGLVKIKQDKAFFYHLEEFEKESKDTKDADTLLIKGELFFVLSQTKKNKEHEEKVKDYFEKSRKDILEILTFLDEDNEKKIIETEILYSLLDSDNKENNGNTFFEETTKNLEPEQREKLNKYKEIFVLSNFIISRLYVNNQNAKYEKYEKLVSHYREKNISQQLLFKDDFKFRLNAIDYSNDPTEGKTFLDFLYGKGNYKTDEELNSEYEAFGSSFAFDDDSLNQFRLYGKEEGKEGTGLSLVFRDSFFSKEAKMDFESPQKDSLKMEMDNPVEDKSALFRCIYIDPIPDVTQPVVLSIGQKEEYLFYREKIGRKYEFYSNEINGITECIREKMVKLRNLVEGLNSEVVGQLLINLRYLTKHIAFKDEQECRIVKIRRLNDKDSEIKNDANRLYIEYSPKVSNHIDKIYFGPKATGFELFKNMLKNKKLDILCEKSKNPLA